MIAPEAYCTNTGTSHRFSAPTGCAGGACRGARRRCARRRSGPCPVPSRGARRAWRSSAGCLGARACGARPGSRRPGRRTRSSACCADARDRVRALGECGRSGRTVACCRAGCRRSATPPAGCPGPPRSGGASSRGALYRPGWPGVLTSAHRPHVLSVDCGTLPVDLPGLVQLLEQQPVQPTLDAGGLPVAQPAPARHPGAKAEFLRQPLPR